MKTAIPWVLVLLLLGGSYFLFSSGQKQEAELAQLRPQVEELARLRAENAELVKLRTQVEELGQLRKDNAELPRLRNEVQRLRKQSQELASQLQTAQLSQSRQQEQLTQRAAENEALRTQSQQFQEAQEQAVMQAQLNGCYNNLRQLSAAKQQWAQDYNQPEDAIPTLADLQPYFPPNAFPACPAGGNYSFNAVGVMPTCSIPSHSTPTRATTAK